MITKFIDRLGIHLPALERRAQIKKRAGRALLGLAILTIGLSQRPDSGHFIFPNLKYAENADFWGRQVGSFLTGDTFTRFGLDLVKEVNEPEIVQEMKFEMKNVQIQQKTETQKADFSFTFADSSGKSRRYHVYDDPNDPASSLSGYGEYHQMFLSEDKESFLRIDYGSAEELFSYVKYLNLIGFNHVDLDVKQNSDKNYYRFVYLPNDANSQDLYPSQNYFHTLEEIKNYPGGIPGYRKNGENIFYLGVSQVFNVSVTLDSNKHDLNGNQVWGVFAKASSDYDKNSKVFRYFRTIPGNNPFDARNRFLATAIGVDDSVLK